MSASELVRLKAENEQLRQQLAALREAMGTPFASLYSHEDALERLREINRRSYLP